jgi:hypothetical protein
MSASAGLAGRDATVATVFTALPDAGRPVTWWDRLTGATSSRQRQRERLAEDRAAMALLGARCVHLDEPEALYRDGDPDLRRAVTRLTALLAGAREVWLPSAIGEHRDHTFARDAGLRAAAAAGHAEVILYADFPYVIEYGWPAWVSGRPDGEYLDTGYWLSDQLASAGLNEASLTPVVTRLNQEQRALKARVIAAYRTQASVLRLAPADLEADPGKLEFEISWRARMDTLGSLTADQTR